MPTFVLREGQWGLKKTPSVDILVCDWLTPVSTYSFRYLKHLRALAALGGREEFCRWYQRCCVLRFITCIHHVLSVTGSYMTVKSKPSLHLVAQSQQKSDFLYVSTCTGNMHWCAAFLIYWSATCSVPQTEGNKINFLKFWVVRGT